MGQLVVLDNSLITSSYELTLNEQRLIYCALKQMPKGVPVDPKTEFYITRQDFIDMGVPEYNATKEIRQATRDLLSKYIIIKTPQGHLKFPWMYSVMRYDKKADDELRERYPNPEDYFKYINMLRYRCLLEAIPIGRTDQDNIEVRLRFHPEIMPFLSDLRNHFTQFFVEDVSQFKSTKTFRIYQLLMKNLDRKTGKGWTYIDITDFRFMLMVVDKYLVSRDLKKWVLEVAKQEINDKSNLNMDYELVKKGHKTIAVKFTYELKEKPKAEQPIQIIEQSNNNHIENITALEKAIIAQKNAYADQQGITDPMHRQNLINQALKQHRQAEQDEQQRKEQEQAQQQAEQAKARAEQLAKDEQERQEREQDEQRKKTFIDMFESLEQQHKEQVLDEVAQNFKGIFAKWFKEAREQGTAHTDVRFLAKFYELFGL